MKGYPSIDRATGQSFCEIPNAYVFDKIDGRNVRVEWSPKKGWDKWGSRHQTFDPVKPEHPEYRMVQSIFNQIYAEPLARLATDRKWKMLTVYLELWQANSLGGVFDPNNNEFYLTLFDLEPFNQCMMGPKEFLKVVAPLVPTAAFLGQINWTRGFVEQVRAGQVDGVTLEGVVAKAGERHKQLKAKAKTQKWVDMILARYGETEGRKMVES
jgi:hypothetical protein